MVSFFTDVSWEQNTIFGAARNFFGQSYFVKALVEFKKKDLDHFSPPSFLTQKCWFQDLRFWSTYSRSSRWCDLLPSFFSKRPKAFSIRLIRICRCKSFWSHCAPNEIKAWLWQVTFFPLNIPEFWKMVAKGPSIYYVSKELGGWV